MEKTTQNTASSSAIHYVVDGISIKDILFIGGDKGSLEQIGMLLEASEHVQIRVVSPVIDSALKKLAQKKTSEDAPQISVFERHYTDEDIRQANYVVVTINNLKICEEIQQELLRQKKWMYFSKNIELSNFFIANNEKNERVLRVFDSNEEKENTIASLRWRRAILYVFLACAFMALGYLGNFIIDNLPVLNIWGMVRDSITELNTHGNLFYWLILTGFIAEMINGSVGMGYKVITTSVLFSVGILPPSTISSSTHTASMISGGVLGYSHYKFKNVNKKLLRAIIIPSIIGTVAGAVALSIYGDKYAHYIKPALAFYTLLLGARILYTTLANKSGGKKIKRVGWLGTLGGFLDSFGGGGWGPIMTGSLISGGRTPRFVVGTVSVVEFFICVASVTTFLVMGKIGSLAIILALVIGGIVAAPLAALVAGKLPKKPAYITVGTLVILWSLKVIISTFL